MKKELLSAFISAVVTMILTIIFQFLGIFFWGDQATIELVSSDYSNNEFTNVLAVKNMMKDEYLKEIVIEIDKTISVNSVIKDGIETDDLNVLKISKISPSKLSIIIINSDKKITNKNISIIKNHQRVSSENFNNNKNFKVSYLILVLCYFVINMFLCFLASLKTKKSHDSINEMYDKANKKADNIEKKLIKIEKEQAYRTKIYLKEMTDRERELKFYQQLLLNQTGNSMTGEELEEFISKNLKTFSKKKIKYLDYEDLLKIVDNIVE